MDSNKQVLLTLSIVLLMWTSLLKADFQDSSRCTLRTSTFLRELNHKLHHVLQCAGYCFSRAYPTPPSVMDSMISPKNITSEALCCVASSWTQLKIHSVTIYNHTACSCGPCYYHQKDI
uniref:Glycoprotein hormones alpha chain n=1 Tax=Eptatretus atami TaxID=50612 RepID=E0D4Q2_9VERT|nr:glycoprotein hormone alpha subunit [Eptatretus atami]